MRDALAFLSALGLAALLALPSAAEPPPPAAPRTPKLGESWVGPKPVVPCTCRWTGGDAELGETICIRRDGRDVALVCDLNQNVTTWREVSDGCAVAPSS